jgi:hypothetical protein
MGYCKVRRSMLGFVPEILETVVSWALIPGILETILVTRE